MLNHHIRISDTGHTSLVSELLSNFWTYLKEQNPGLCLTKITRELMEWKTWVERMTPGSFFWETVPNSNSDLFRIWS
jgi:hypothetical protein